MKRILKIVVVAAIIILVAVEVLLRFQLAKSEKDFISNVKKTIIKDMNGKQKVIRRIHSYMYFDRNGTFSILPNSCGYHKSYDDPSKPVIIKINSNGLRGHELQRSYDNRILFLGDSIVFDGGVPLERTFVYQLENKINQHGRVTEIINMGTTDIGVDQYFKKLIYHGVYLNPDYLFIGFYLNDSISPQGYLGPDSLDTIEKLFETGYFLQIRIIQKLLKLYRTMKYSMKKEFRDRFEWINRYKEKEYYNDSVEFAKLIEEARLDWGAAWLPASWGKVRYYLGRINKICIEEGIKPVIICFPVEAQVYANNEWKALNYPQKQLEKIADEFNMAFLDLLPLLQKTKPKGIFADQCHYNAAGNDLIAELIYQSINNDRKISRDLSIDK
ncbi:SGNH/GDSL hydrolase family protein [Elusimicrobiota bacterium]